MIKDWLIKLLGLLSRTERSTEDELIAYGRELEREEQRKGHVQIYIDPTIRGYPQGGAYDNLGPVTEKPTILHNTRGRYAQQRWPEFKKTHLMPTVKRPPQDEPPITAEMTQVRIPTWLL